MTEPTRPDLLSRLSELARSGYARLYLEEKMDGGWVLRIGGPTDDVAGFLRRCEAAGPMRVRPAVSVQDAEGGASW